MEHMELQMHSRDAETEALWKELQGVKKKEDSKTYAEMWENNLTPETHDPIAELQSIYKFGLSVCLFVCLFVSNKRKNDRTDRAQYF